MIISLCIRITSAHNFKVSRPRELPPESLSELYVNLSVKCYNKVVTEVANKI